jgi:hypothetical protein
VHGVHCAHGRAGDRRALPYARDVRVDAAIELPARIQEAWSVLSDWERQAEWMRDADRVEVLTPFREGEGVALAVRTRVYGIPLFTERLEVVAWDPPARLAVAHRSIVQGTGTWLCAPTTRGTHLTWTEDVTLPVPILGELAVRAYAPYLRSLMGRSLAALRSFIVATGPVRS